MQQPPQMIPVMPSFPPTNITTEQIQKYLDDNKKLILAILDNQNLGKLAECAQYQALLQKNLMYLAAIADAQPQAPAAPPQVGVVSMTRCFTDSSFLSMLIIYVQHLQMAPHPAMQQAGYYMQHPQAAAMAQQQGIFSPKMPMQFNNMHQMHDPQQHQQAMQGQIGMRPGGPNGMPSMLHTEATHGGGSGGPNSAGGPNDGRGGSKQDASESGAGGDGQGTSAGGRGNGDGEDGK
ncbi:hypothetical protein DVH24_011959 [Malus domestica]|uniref:SS18 N-terminal domain-containing protein n=1 Tax=Malus domestica TaxID=3750 RepID=A0A498JDK0_MALDO|nr:hypothetical protein DVH24_011959 [Malus domestica]